MNVFESEKAQKIIEKITCLQSLISEQEEKLLKEIKMSKTYYDELAFATANYQHILKRYLDYFNTFFKFKANVFYYGSYKGSRIVTITNLMACTELGIDHNAFEDSPVFVEPENTTSGCFLTWPGFSEGCEHFSSFHRQRAEQFNVGCGLGIQMKYKHSYEFLAWMFARNDALSIEIQRQQILQEYRDKLPVIAALVQQFKETIHPIVEKKSLRRVKLSDLKSTQGAEQRHATSNATLESLVLPERGVTILTQKPFSLEQTDFRALTDEERKALADLNRASAA